MRIYNRYLNAKVKQQFKDILLGLILMAVGTQASIVLAVITGLLQRYIL